METDKILTARIRRAEAVQDLIDYTLQTGDQTAFAHRVRAYRAWCDLKTAEREEG